MTARALTQEELMARKNFNFDRLLEPYKWGGTKEDPVKRTIGTIFDYLINKKKYPVDVAGAAMLIVFNEMYRGKVFEGDGTYGSPGRELVSEIRMKCDAILQMRLRSQVFENIAGARMEALEELAFEMVRNMMPWFVRILAPKAWKWLRKRKKEKDVATQRN